MLGVTRMALHEVLMPWIASYLSRKKHGTKIGNIRSDLRSEMWRNNRVNKYLVKELSHEERTNKQN